MVRFHSPGHQSMWHSPPSPSDRVAARVKPQNDQGQNHKTTLAPGMINYYIGIDDMG